MVRSFWQFGNLYTGKEMVMGLPNSVVFADGEWQGLLLDPDRAIDLEELIEAHADWRPRDEAEEDEEWQQIYPFAVYKYGDQYLELKRGTTASHRRMHLKYTLGLGGHVVQQEYEQFGSLQQWMTEMFHHDMAYEGDLKLTRLGVLNDNSDKLGNTHLLLVYLLEGDNAHFETRKGHQEARLVRLQDMKGDDIEFLERWSQMIFRQLRDAERQQGGESAPLFHVSQLKEGS